MRGRSLVLVPLLQLACSTAPATCPKPTGADMGAGVALPSTARVPTQQPHGADWRELWVVLMSSTTDDRSDWPASVDAALEDLCVGGCEGVGPKLILHHEGDDGSSRSSSIRVAMEFDDGVAAADPIVNWGFYSFAPRCGAHDVEIDEASVARHGDVVWVELDLLVPGLIDTCESEGSERDDEASSWVEDDCTSCQHVPRSCIGLYSVDGLELVEGDTCEL